MPPAAKKPLSNAERARKYRERKAAEKAAALAAAQAERDARDAAAAEKIPTQLEATKDAIKAMQKWLKDSDGAAVAMALRTSKQYDDLYAADPTQTTKLTSIGQLLARYLHELGGTPTVRLQHELRSARIAAGLPPEVPHAGTVETVAQPRAGEATVTSIQRPPKRTRPA